MSQDDRNFDDLAERFAKKVYGGLKGDIRLAVIWRDLEQKIPELMQANGQQPLRVLDLGGGLGQISLKLAEQGHTVVFNDISAVMVKEAQQRAEDAGISGQFQWQVGPYQALNAQALGKFDLILCHAVLEWLEKPAQMFTHLEDFCHEYSGLSLCFYNPASKIYRNLMHGNFNMLSQDTAYRSNKGSLTPNNPSEPDEVKQWLIEHDFKLEHVSGLRVFHDYALDKRGGNKNPEDVLVMELKYSQQEPFKWLGRYLHFYAVK